MTLSGAWPDSFPAGTRTRRWLQPRVRVDRADVRASLDSTFHDGPLLRPQCANRTNPRSAKDQDSACQERAVATAARIGPGTPGRYSYSLLSSRPSCSRSAASCGRPVCFDLTKSARLRYGTRTPAIRRTIRRGYARSKVTPPATVRISTRGSSPTIVNGFDATASGSSSAAPRYGRADTAPANR